LVIRILQDSAGFSAQAHREKGIVATIFLLTPAGPPLQQEPQDYAPDHSMQSKGEILLKSGDDSLRPLESGFGQSFRDHAVHWNRPGSSSPLSVRAKT